MGPCQGTALMLFKHYMFLGSLFFLVTNGLNFKKPLLICGAHPDFQEPVCILLLLVWNRTPNLERTDSHAEHLHPCLYPVTDLRIELPTM